MHTRHAEGPSHLKKGPHRAERGQRGRESENNPPCVFQKDEGRNVLIQGIFALNSPTRRTEGMISLRPSARPGRAQTLFSFTLIGEKSKALPPQKRPFWRQTNFPM
ncbi:hypothetical protein SKAU_G00419670 [Synaphobranchus kaupii]|uniref:Uncharacterized protein n=1 Tax=Synaphobranchus kaupii TaxID=118154 RepID=A0A9Q1E6E8_SYNKA|nr:hypothetical protein SKAU_G00419670 [Synaphobranchus kaupii]